MTISTYKVLVSGKVQGVYFRASAKQVAEDLGLKGYAKNLPDGSVELVVQGEAKVIEKFIHWCRKGPSSANVEHFEYGICPNPSLFTDFKKL